MPNRTDQTTVPLKLRELEARIRALEAVAGGACGAVLWDFPNSCGYLDITTNDVDGGGLGYNIDNQSAGGARIGSKHALFLQAANGSVFVNLANGSNDFDVGADDAEFDISGVLHTTGAPIQIDSASSHPATVRWVGGTASGHPTTGTWDTGDAIWTLDGHMWICTVAGTPGTWVDVGGGGGGGTITDITSVDSSITVTDPTGPTTDLSVAFPLTSDEKDALDAANSPDSGNPFATIADIAASGIQFSAANNGSWLDIETTGTDGSGYGMHFLSDGAGGPIVLDTPSGNTQINAGDTTFQVQNGGGITSVLGAGTVLGFVEHTDSFFIFSVKEDGSASEFRLGSGGVFTLYDSSGDPMLQMTEGSPNLHIPAGGTVVANL